MAAVELSRTIPVQPTAASMAIATAIVAGLGGYFLGQASSLGFTRGLLSNEARRHDRKRHHHRRRTTSPSSSSSLSALSAASESGSGSGSGSGSRLSAASDEISTSDDETDVQSVADLKDFKDKSKHEHKLVLVARSDLGMSKGKIAAQCSHATLACYKTLLNSGSSAKSILRRWERTGQGKVALQVRGEDELLMLQARAISLGLCAQIVRDAGRTQIAAGSATVLGVGPGPKGVVDQVTGHLKLL